MGESERKPSWEDAKVKEAVMTIDEAIKILTVWKEEGEGESRKLEIAENMAMEALKRCKEQRSGTALDEYDFLPGETKE